MSLRRLTREGLQGDAQEFVADQATDRVDVSTISVENLIDHINLLKRDAYGEWSEEEISALKDDMQKFVKTCSVNTKSSKPEHYGATIFHALAKRDMVECFVF